VIAIDRQSDGFYIIDEFQQALFSSFLMISGNAEYYTFPLVQGLYIHPLGGRVVPLNTFLM
jgi:hypothetical protein